MENEIWKDVIGYEGKYEVSNMGRVRSLNYRMTGDRKVMKHALCSGYPSVTLCKDKKHKNIHIHAIEAIAFIDPDYLKKGLMVNHKDFNRQNNLLSNLEIVTCRENNNQKHLSSASKYTGVTLNSGKWISIIIINRKKIYLGRFDTEIEASEYYEAALICVNEGREIDIVIKRRKTKGYYFCKGSNKWKSKIWISGKAKHLGYFNTEEEASNVFELAKKQLRKK